MKHYAKYSIVLYDVIEIYPNILDILKGIQFDDKEDSLYNKFISCYGLREIGSETPGEFKLIIERVYNENFNKFKTLYDIHKEKFDWQQRQDDLSFNKDNKIDYKGNNDTNVESIGYSLPNTVRDNEYATEKETQNSTSNTTSNETFNETSTHTLRYGYNPVEQKEKYEELEFKDVEMDFIYQFENCFLQIF